MRCSAFASVLAKNLRTCQTGRLLAHLWHSGPSYPHELRRLLRRFHQLFGQVRADGHGKLFLSLLRFNRLSNFVSEYILKCKSLRLWL
jgi:hypothetical protein